MAAITIRRGTAIADRRRAYRILVDGEEAGRVRDGQDLRLDVACGKHVLEARIDWVSSGPLELEIGDEGRVVAVRPRHTLLQLSWQIIASFFFLFDRDKFLVLEPVN